MSDHIAIKTPRGAIHTTQTASGSVTASLKWDPSFAPKKKENFSRAQKFIDSECIRLMAPETPVLTRTLVLSATLGTVIGSGEIVQSTPYSRRQYYEHSTKGRWFEKTKNRHKEQIKEGAGKIAGK